MIPKMMKALVAHGQGKYALEQVPVPEIGPGDALVRVEACASKLALILRPAAMRLGTSSLIRQRYGMV